MISLGSMSSPCSVAGEVMNADEGVSMTNDLFFKPYA